ncbi:MAG TPA: PQQ-binding-like beta-propeller repeat protein [Iamia sp.]|nr:PQQ-binding-like beta-propeller repeat protein [Iamia sp.]
MLVLVAGAALVLVTRSDGGAASSDFGAGPGSEPDEAWAVDLDHGDDDDVSVLSDGERAYVLTATEIDDDEDFSSMVTVTAYAAGDGEELWSEELEGDLFDDPVRLLGDDQLLLGDSDGDGDESTRLLDAATGDEVWEADGRPVDTQLALGYFGPTIDPGDLDEILLTTEDDDGDQSVVAIDRESGDELWDEDGDDALVCEDVVVTIVEGETDSETFTPAPAEITGRDDTTGDELWTRDALPGLCDDGEIALGTGDGEITLVDVETGDEGTVFDPPGHGDFLIAIPFGDHVAVSQYSFSEEEDDALAQASVHPRDGGDPIWEEDDTFVFPITDDLLIAADDSNEDATLIRVSDGEELGEIPVNGDENECDGALTHLTVVVCETGDPDVTSYRLDTDVEELWTVDAGADVVQVAVGGDTLFAVTEDELVALR